MHAISFTEHDRKGVMWSQAGGGEVGVERSVIKGAERRREERGFGKALWQLAQVAVLG